MDKDSTIKSKNNNTEYTPLQKCQKLLSSCTAFPSLSHAASSDKSSKAELVIEKSYLLVEYENQIKTHNQRLNMRVTIL